MRFLLPFLLAASVAAVTANAETPIEHSNETRFQLDLKVPDAELAKFVPSGFTMNVSTTGAAKDCNVRVVFIDRVTINNPDGTPKGKGSNRLVYLAVPVKNAAGEGSQLIIGGLTADDAPGPYANYLLASKHSMTTETSGFNPILQTQHWSFQAATGEHLEMDITFQRGSAAVRPLGDTKFYSAKNPTFYQISRQEQVLDIMKNVTTNPPDHVKSFKFKAGGGSWSKLFDGTEKVLSWDNILWLNRTVLLP